MKNALLLPAIAVAAIFGGQALAGDVCVNASCETDRAWTFIPQQKFNAPPLVSPATVAQIGTCVPAQTGAIGAVSDGDAGLAAGQTVVNSGGGATYYPVTCNGSAWVVTNGTQTFTANNPLIGTGTGVLAQGTRSGNTTAFATASGALTSGHGIVADASGNVIDSGGYALAGSAPAASVCGTSPAVSTGSSNLAGEVTTGTGAPTACTITFSAAFPTHAFCTVTPEFAAATATAHISALSNSAFTVTFSAGVTSGKFTYVCGGN